MSASMSFKLREIEKYYEDRLVLRIPKLDLKTGELFAVVGPSGSGKSTFLRMLDFLEPCDAGNIDFFDSKVEFSESDLIRREIGMLFQRPELTIGNVANNIALPLKLRKDDSYTKVDKVINKLSLSSLSERNAKNLSGGEIQRVALARVLVTNPKVLLLDEPTANLDPYHVELIENTVRELKEDGVTIILVTHNVFQAKRLADRIGLLLNGEFVEIAETKEFFENPKDSRVKDFLNGKMFY